MKSVEEQILGLLPNREQVLHFIWDNLEGPLSDELNKFVLEKIGEYGSWKEKSNIQGALLYKGWVYNQKKQGRWIYMFKNGELHKDCFYRNNVYNGLCKLCEPDGSYELNQYHKGKLNGERLRFDKKGILFQKWVYKMGRHTEFYGPVELGLYAVDKKSS